MSNSETLRLLNAETQILTLDQHFCQNQLMDFNTPGTEQQILTDFNFNLQNFHIFFPATALDQNQRLSRIKPNYLMTN